MYRKKGRRREEKGSYSIGEASRTVGLSQKTLRDYEKVGLLRPARQPRTNNRIYTDYEIAQIERVSELLHSEGFTLPCLVRLLQLAPCWKIFDCDVRTECSAYLNPHEPCYVVRDLHGTMCEGACEQCAVYINRSGWSGTVLRRPGASSGRGSA